MMVRLQLASAASWSMPATPSSVGIRSAWLVGMSSSRAPSAQRTGQDERDVERLLIGDVPLLVHAAVGALHVAVVGAEHDDRVLVCAVPRRASSTRVICSSTVACTWK